MWQQDVTAEKPVTVDNLQLEPTQLPAILINTDINNDEIKPLLTICGMVQITGINNCASRT